MEEKVIIFNGDLDSGEKAVSHILSSYITKQLDRLNIDYTVYNIADSDIPLLDFSFEEPTASIKEMAKLLTEADIHIWLSPLYHGGIPGAMKNTLDWLEITAGSATPYLTDKKVGLVCWANGTQAMQGINNMDAIVKALRAWSLPYSVPIMRNDLMDVQNPSTISRFYQEKLQRLIRIATSKKIETESPDNNE